jgi:predicted negative regulator of RcsB-dependent stress response
MPKAIKKKSRKKPIETETEVKDKISDLFETVRVKQKTVLTYGVGALVVALAIAALFLYRYYAAEKSRELTYQAYKFYYNEYQGNSLSKEERVSRALDLFQKAYMKNRSAPLLLYIASSLYELERFDEALDKLNDFTKKYSSEKNLIPLAYQKMAMIHLKKGAKDEALKTLHDLINSESTIYKDYALIESGRILENAGKKEEAIEKYKKLSELHSDSPFYDEAQAKLNAFEAKNDREAE